jgi:small subunit ribosomal protein S11
MSINYRLKLPKNAIKFKKIGNFTLDKFSNFTNKKSQNFLLDCYSEPLFTKISRLNVDKLSNILKEPNDLQKVSDKKDSFKKIMRNKLTAKNFQRNSNLNQIYNYEKEYFKTSWQTKANKDIFLGSPAFNVKKKSSRLPKTNLRYEKKIAEMIKMHLNHYYSENFSVDLDPKVNEISFFPTNKNSSQLKAYQQSLKDSSGYLYVNFSKKNLFLTLTDLSGNCIVYLSSGAEGLKRREKQKPFATRILTNRISKVAKSKNINKLIIIFNPNNRYQRWRIKPVIRTLELRGILIERVQRKIVQAHGGCRKKKSRRI